MKSYLIIPLCFCLLLASCTLRPEYIGQKLAPTSSVAVFYSADDVKRPYKIIGHFVSHKYIKSAVERNLVIHAEKVGADAVIITGPDGSNIKRIAADAIKYQ